MKHSEELEETEKESSVVTWCIPITFIPLETHWTHLRKLGYLPLFHSSPPLGESCFHLIP
jgi:hypothetical protein